MSDWMRQAELEEAVQLLQRVLNDGMTPELRAEIDEFLEVPRECGVVRSSSPGLTSKQRSRLERFGNGHGDALLRSDVKAAVEVLDRLRRE